KSIQMKYQPQYVRNVLQRNNGNNTFSDIGYMSGIYATDWSWSTLLADFDNDGLRDIFITNGYPKDVTDLDFVTYNREATMFGTDDLKRKSASKAIQGLDGVFKPNFLFHNKGDFEFENVAVAWGMSEKAYSTGAAYADFDNDGDLDLVINNLNGEAQLYENQTNPGQREEDGRFVRINFTGVPGNPQGLGAKIWVYSNGQSRYGEQQLQRGYLSSVDPVMHFGLGSATIDSLLVVWPGNYSQVVYDVKINSLVTVSYDDANPGYSPAEAAPTLLTEDTHLPLVVQQETEFVDYKHGQPTLPHK